MEISHRHHHRHHTEKLDLAPPVSPNSPSEQGLLDRLVGKTLLYHEIGSMTDLAQLMQPPLSPPVTSQRKSNPHHLHQQQSPSTSTAGSSSSSGISMGDELDRLAIHSPSFKQGNMHASMNRSFLALDDFDSDGDDLDNDNDKDSSAEEHLNKSIAALEQFTYDSPRSSMRSARYRAVDTDDAKRKELDDEDDSSGNHGHDSSTRGQKQKKADKKYKTTGKKVKKPKGSDSSSSTKLSSMASSSKAKSPSSVIVSPRLRLRSARANEPQKVATDDHSNSTSLAQSAREQSLLRSPGVMPSPHRRGVAASLSSNRSRRRLSHMVGKPYIPKIVNTMKQDTVRLEQLSAQIKAIHERKQSELFAVEERRSMTMQQLQADFAAKSQSIVGLIAPSASDLKGNKRLAEQLRRENAQIREHNQQMRTNCQNIRINNARLEEKTTELADYKTQLVAHHKRVTDEHEKLRAMDEQYGKEVRELEATVEQETEKARYAHLNRARFESRAYEVAELIRYHDKDNKDLHRLVEAILHATDSQKHMWPKSNVDRHDMKQQAASSRRASMRESL